MQLIYINIYLKGITKEDGDNSLKLNNKTINETIKALNRNKTVTMATLLAR